MSVDGSAGGGCKITLVLNQAGSHSVAATINGTEVRVMHLFMAGHEPGWVPLKSPRPFKLGSRPMSISPVDVWVHPFLKALTRAM